jgi:hypothetical protein
MDSTQELDELALKVKQTYYQDGLADLFMGGFMLLFAVFLAAAWEIQMLPTSLSTAPVILPPIFVSFALMFLFAYLIEAAKKRWVYPRTGYVKLQPVEEATRRDSILGILLILSLLFGPLIFTAVFFGPLGLDALVSWGIPVSVGLLLGIGPMVVARKYQLKRYYIFAVLPGIIGLVLPWFITSMVSIYARLFFTLAIELATVGFIAALSGLVLFFRFLRRYPVQPVDLKEGDVPSALL